MNRRGFLKSTALALGAAPLGVGADQGIRLPDLDAGGFWTFQKFLGAGSATVQGGGKEAVLFFESSGQEGMAASFRSSLIVVEPSREYIISYEIRTHDLEAITARLAGGVYVHFQDANNRFGAFAPTGESVAPRNTEWKTRTVTVTVPTTARTMELHLAYAAYGDLGWRAPDGYRTSTGPALGAPPERPAWEEHHAAQGDNPGSRHEDAKGSRRGCELSAQLPTWRAVHG